MSGAIARTAERVYNQELSAEQQKVARAVFLRLTELGEGMQETRRRVRLSELIPYEQADHPQQVREVINRLADARLVTVSEENVEVAHEALIREWPALREWLAADRAGLLLYHRLTVAAQEWELLKREPGALYRGSRLAQAQEWALAHPGQLNAQEQAFLQEALAAALNEANERDLQRQKELEAAQRLAKTEKQRAEEQALSASRLRRRALGLSIALLLAGLLAIASIWLAREAGKNSQAAQTAQAQAENKSTQALAMQATAEAEAAMRATQQAISEKQARLASSRELIVASASNLQVDPELGLLLSLEALKKADMLEARNSLRQTLIAFRLVATIQAHTGRIIGVAANLQGNRFATAGLDGLVKIWSWGNSTAQPYPTQQLKLANPVDFRVFLLDNVRSTLAFSPDGSRLAAIGENKSINIWEANSGRLLQSLIDEDGIILDFSFSPDGKQLVTVNERGKAKVWNYQSGQQIQIISVPAENIMIAGFTPDNKLLVTGSENNMVRFWDLVSKPINQLFYRDFGYELGPPEKIAFSPDGRYMAIGGHKGVKVWNLVELQNNPLADPLFIASGQHYLSTSGLVYSIDGKYLVNHSGGGLIRVWDATTGQELFIMGSFSGTEKETLSYFDSLATYPDKVHLISTQSDGKVKIWDISPSGGSERWNVYPAQSGQFSPDGKRLATISTSDVTGKFRGAFLGIFPNWRQGGAQ